MEIEDRRFQWQPLIELIVVLATVVGTTVPLYIHTDYKMEEHRRETNDILKAIKEDMRQFQIEMKDFHGRLYGIEERNKRNNGK